MRKNRKKILLWCALGINPMFWGNASAAPITTPLSGDTVTLQDGDVVDINGSSYAISVSGGGGGLQINGAADISLVSTPGGNAVTINNSLNNNLGNGTSISTTGATYGIRTFGNGSLQADHLSVTVNTPTTGSTAVYGMYVQVGNNVDLGTGSISKVESGGTARAEGINLLTVQNFEATDLEINVKNTGTGGVDAVTLQASTADFGVGSKIITSVASQDANNNGFYMGDGHLTGEQLTIEMSGGKTAVGIYATDAYASSSVDLNQSSVTVTGAKNVYGVAGLGSTIVFDEGKVIVSGSDNAYGITIEDGGTLQSNTLNVQADSSANNAVGLNVYNSGGTVTTATLLGEITIVSDDVAMLAENTGSQITGTGKMTLTGDIVASGGSGINLAMQSNSSLIGGAQYEKAASSSLDLEMTESEWTMTKNSSVRALGLDDSTVNFATNLTGGIYGTLTTETLSGTGNRFNLRTDIAGGRGDLLVVEDAVSGSHDLAVTNNGAANVTGDETLVIVRTTDTNAKNYFTLIAPVDLGGYQYELRATALDAADLELYSTGRSTGPGSASVNIFSGAYLLNYAETQTLLQRMGDLREGESKGNIWARAFGGKFNSSSDGFLSGFDMSYSGIQVGADRKIILKDNQGELYVGGMFGYSKGNLDYGMGSGSIDSKTIGAYATRIAPNGFYADIVLKYGWMKNDFKVLDSAGARVTGSDISTDGFTGSLEFGRRIHKDKITKEGWYVEPQVQFSVGRQSGGSFTASNGLRVDVDSYKSTLGRIGANLGYEVKSGENPINVYAKASYVHEFDGDVEYRFNGSSEQTSFGDSWWTYGLGVTAQINKKHNVYLDIERSSGGQFRQSWALNGGYRFSW